MIPPRNGLNAASIVDFIYKHTFHKLLLKLYRILRNFKEPFIVLFFG
jgi:hypothetical protein